MVFSGPVNYRHLLSATCASAITLGVVAAPAEAAVDPIGRECKAATAAAKLGQPIPNIGNFVFGPNENVIDGNLVRIYAPDKYKPYITKATDQWTSATGGLIRFEYVNQPGYKVVTVREANLGGYVVGRVQGTVDNMQLLLNPDILRNGYIDSLVMTITHELGHAMGLAHSCDGALMKDGSNRGKVATTLQPLDVQVLIQANNLRQYGGRPATTTTAAPAPVTTTAAPEPQTLEEAQAALADANSALTAAQRNLDAAQAKYDAIPAWQILSKTAAEQDVNAAQGRVARAQSAVQSAEALVEKFSPTPAPEAPTASPTTAVQTAGPATTSEPSIVYVTETVPAPEPTVEPTSEAPQPETSTVVEEEPTPETTSSEAEPTTSDTQVALPKPTSLREAQQAFEVAQAEYVAALDALQVARVTGIGLAKAQEEIANALAAYGQASENRREYIAAHPDEVLETTSNQQPSAPSEPSPTTTSAPSSEEPAPSSTVPTSAPSPIGAATSTQQPSQAPSTTTTQKTTSTSVSTPAQSSSRSASSEAAATSAPSTVQAVTPAQETTSTVTTTRTAAQQSTATRATTPAVSTSSTTTKRVSMAPSSTTQKTTAISVSTPAQSSSSTPASSEAAATSAPSTVQAATPAPQATPTSTRATTPELSTSSTMPSSSEISTSATTSANSLTSSTSASTTKPQESEAAGTTVASISEEHTSTSKPGYVIEITGEHRATTIQVGPTRAPISATTSREPATTAKQAPAATTKVTTSTEPAAATQPQSSTSAPAISRETSTVNVDITVTNGDLRDVKEGDAVTNGGSPVAAIIIPVVALLLAALGATGWAHMNGLF